MKKKERNLMRQSKSTAVTLVEEQSQNLEEEAQIRVIRLAILFFSLDFSSFNVKIAKKAKVCR